MKKKIVTIGVMSLLLNSACLQAGNRATVTDVSGRDTEVLQKGDFRSVIKKDFNANAIKSMTVTTVSGDVRVTGDATGHATVEVLAKGPNNQSLSATEIQRRLDKYYRIITELNGSQLLVKVEFKQNNIRNKEGLLLKFVLHTPERADAEIHTVSGDVAINGAKGVGVSTTSGDIDVTALAGKADLSSVSGDIDAHRINGQLGASTTSGDITAREVETLMEAKSVSGDIQVSAGTIANDTRVKTVSGDVGIRIKEHADLTLSLSTLSGDFDLNQLGDIQYKTKSKRAIEATVGKGGKTLRVKTISGDIKISHNNI